MLARAHLTSSRPPGLVVLLHPLLAASGLILLGASYVRAGGPTSLLVALGLLVLAAGGGISIATWRVNRGPAPAWVIGLRALLALCGSGLVLFELLAADPNVPRRWRARPLRLRARARLRSTSRTDLSCS